MDSYRDRYRQMKIELGMDGDEVSKMNQKLDRLETSTARPFKVWISWLGIVTCFACRTGLPHGDYPCIHSKRARSMGVDPPIWLRQAHSLTSTSKSPMIRCFCISLQTSVIPCTGMAQIRTFAGTFSWILLRIPPKKNILPQDSPSIGFLIGNPAFLVVVCMHCERQNPCWEALHPQSQRLILFAIFIRPDRSRLPIIPNKLSGGYLEDHLRT